MKPQKVSGDGQALRLPIGGVLKGDDVLYHIQKGVNEITLPSIKGEMMKAWGAKLFILDADRCSSQNPITILAQGDDKINGESKIVLNHSGGSLMLVPVSYNDWGCFFAVRKEGEPAVVESAVSESGQ